jgi:hypothetical protein
MEKGRSTSKEKQGEVAMGTLNKICFTVCVVAVALAMIFGLAMIWTDIDPAIAWKVFLTLSMFVGGAAAVSGINEFFNRQKG